MVRRGRTRIVLVTNPSPIGQGILTEGQVEAINRRLVSEIEAHSRWVDGIYYCSHGSDYGCQYRKPEPGLLRAGRELDLDLACSYLIGDAVSDVETALAAGCSPSLVLTGRGEAQRASLEQRGHDRVPVRRDLAEEVELVLDGGGLGHPVV